ncbi:hypothetical protein [Synechococcus sp. WH 8101]|uniref:hypothetical protein n=1 Tax=Synechococcus sp. WH 8101 TaxID=59932 RepID=UPI001023BDDD|nr:hypothetical protein [Synechococcus sp. WH 8101]
MGARDWIAAVLLSAALVTPVSRALESNGPMAAGAYAMQASCRLADGLVRACIKERRSGRILGSRPLVSELEKE